MEDRPVPLSHILKSRLVAGLSALAIGLAVHAAPGDIDPEFGAAGIVTSGFGYGQDYAHDLHRQADGKLVVMQSDLAGVIRLFRLNADGTRDPWFGVNGVREILIDPTSLAIDPEYGLFPKLAVDAAGRFVIAIAHVPTGSTTARAAIYRTLPDGNVDLSFGSQGRSELAAFASTHIAIATDSSNRVLVAGTRSGTTDQQTIARILENGDGDTTFGTDGFVYFSLNPTAAVGVSALRIDGSGRLLWGGTTLNNFVFHRRLADGSLDASFNGGAPRFVYPGSGNTNGLEDMIVDPQGRILGAGRRATDRESGTLALVRLLDDGTPDPQFSDDGLFLDPQTAQDAPLATQLRVDSLGRILAGGGYYAPNLASKCGIVRVLDNGTLDASYGISGRLYYKMVTWVNGPDTCRGVALLPGDGAMMSGTVGYAKNVGVARITAAGAVDTTFNGTGFAFFDIADRNAAIAAVRTHTSAGKIVVAGMAASGDGPNEVNRAVVLRYTADGMPDATFGTAGRTLITFDLADNHASGLAIDHAERLLVSISNNRSATACTLCGGGVMRLTPTGQPDGTFGPYGMYFPPDAASARARAVAYDARGYVMVAEEQREDPNGTFENAKIRIARVLDNGTRDPAFGTNGVVYLPLVVPDQNRASAIAVDGSYRLLVAGARFTGNAVSSPFLWRLTPEGAVDVSFGTNGVAFPITSGGVSMQEITSIAVDGAGRTYVTGPANGDFVVARLTANGQLDATFGSGGLARPAQTGAVEESRSVAIQGAGILLGGSATAEGKLSFALVSLDASGNANAAFGPGGLRTYALSRRDEAGFALALQGDGKAVLAGSTRNRIGLIRAEAAVTPPPVTAARHDFDSSGKPDIIFRHTITGDTFIWRMNGLAFVSDHFLAGGRAPHWKIVGHGDFNGDGQNDIAWHSTQFGSLLIRYLDNGAYLSEEGIDSFDPTVWIIETVADFNADGKPDFLFRHANSGLGFVWYFNDRTPGASQYLYTIDNAWVVENTGDFNNDGYPDFFFRNTQTGLGFVWLWNGSALGASYFLFSIDPVWQVAQIVDWNNDGVVDLVFHNSSTGVAFVWYTNGTQLLGSDFLFQVDPVWAIVPYR